MTCVPPAATGSPPAAPSAASGAAQSSDALGRDGAFGRVLGPVLSGNTSGRPQAAGTAANDVPAGAPTGIGGPGHRVSRSASISKPGKKADTRDSTSGRKAEAARDIPAPGALPGAAVPPNPSVTASAGPNDPAAPPSPAAASESQTAVEARKGAATEGSWAGDLRPHSSAISRHRAASAQDAVGNGTTPATAPQPVPTAVLLPTAAGPPHATDQQRPKAEPSPRAAQPAHSVPTGGVSSIGDGHRHEAATVPPQPKTPLPPAEVSVPLPHHKPTHAAAKPTSDAASQTASTPSARDATAVPGLGTQAPAPAPTSHAGAPAASPPTPVPAAQLAPALVSLVHAAHGTQHLTVRLEPAELGHVEVRVNRSAHAPVRVDVTVQRPETLALLVRDQAHLQHALDKAGLPSDGRNLVFHIAPPPPPPPSPAPVTAPHAATTANPGGDGSGGPGGGGASHPDFNGQHTAPPGWMPLSDEDSTGMLATSPAARWLRAGLDITA